MNIIITAGGTSEALGFKRVITNIDSGKYGSLLANSLVLSDKVEKIFYVSPEKCIKPKKNDKIEFVDITNISSVCKAIEEILNKEDIDFVFHTMTTSDHTIEYAVPTDKIAMQLACMSTAESSDNQMLVRVIKDTIDQLNNPHDTLSRREIETAGDKDIILRLKPAPNLMSAIKEKSPKTTIVKYHDFGKVKHEKAIDLTAEMLDQKNIDYVNGESINGEDDYFFVMKKGRTVKSFHDRKEVFGYLEDIL